MANDLLDLALFSAAAAEAGLADTSAVEMARPVIADPALATTMQAAFAATTDPAADPLGREDRLAALLWRMLRRHASACAPPPATGPVARARRRIDDDPTAPYLLAVLAAEAGLSRFQLLRGFARETGMTPHAYLLSRRVMLARRLIMDGTPLAEASTAAGFADQSHMNRAFVRRLGATPGAYAAAGA